MRNLPFWLVSTPIKRFPRLQSNVKVDALVVGAGVTGITSAYFLKKAGLTVALIERERVASIDTGHTTAHLTYVTDVELQNLVRNFGEDHAQDRKKIKGATWNYLRENKGYPYYMIKDRVTRPEADSVRELKHGEGMIIGSRGKKRATFRDHNEKLRKLSPVCTHLGCLVRWNAAESTWDCPCHGSRFKPTGEVIAGPAEEALTPI